MTTSTLATSASRASASLTSSCRSQSGRIPKWVERIAYADSNGVGDALGKSLCLLDGPAGNYDLDARLAEDLSSRAGDETSTEQQNRPWNCQLRLSQRFCRVYSLSGGVDAAENSLELVCDSQQRLNWQKRITH